MERVPARYSEGMLLYLDMCCLKRPFDDQSQSRIRLETEAVLGLMAAESASLQFIRSAALWLENEQNPLPVRAARVRRWLGDPQPLVNAADVAARTNELITHGFGSFDAFHLASAEAAGADAIGTCDDRLLSLARRVAGVLRVRVVGVVQLADEVLS